MMMMRPCMTAVANPPRGVGGFAVTVKTLVGVYADVCLGPVYAHLGGTDVSDFQARPLIRGARLLDRGCERWQGERAGYRQRSALEQYSAGKLSCNARFCDAHLYRPRRLELSPNLRTRRLMPAALVKIHAKE